MAKLNLYKVTVEYVLYVVAGDQFEAEDAMRLAEEDGYVDPTDATTAVVVGLDVKEFDSECIDQPVSLGDMSVKTGNIFANMTPGQALAELQAAITRGEPHNDDDEDDDDTDSDDPEDSKSDEEEG